MSQVGLAQAMGHAVSAQVMSSAQAMRYRRARRHRCLPWIRRGRRDAIHADHESGARWRIGANHALGVVSAQAMGPAQAMR